MTPLSSSTHSSGTGSPSNRNMQHRLSDVFGGDAASFEIVANVLAPSKSSNSEDVTIGTSLVCTYVGSLGCDHTVKLAYDAMVEAEANLLNEIVFMLTHSSYSMSRQDIVQVSLSSSDDMIVVIFG